MEKFAIRVVFKTDDTTYLEQIVVLESVKEQIFDRINRYCQDVREMNPSWERIGNYLGSESPDLQYVPDGSVVWHIYYESSLPAEQFLERKYSNHS
jgi:hypothetical protein